MMAAKPAILEKTKEPGIVRRIGPRETTYVVTISAGLKPDGTRNQVRRSFPTFDLAKAFKTKTNHDRRSGAYVAPSREKLGDYLDRWCDDQRGRIKSNSILAYRQARARLAILHDTALADLTTDKLQRTQQRMLAAGLAATSVALTFRILKIAMKDAVATRLLPASPFLGFKALNVPRFKPKRLTTVEVAAFRAAIEDDPRRVFWEVALETGMRVAELAALRWDAVDLVKGEIAVVRTLTRREDATVVEGTPKSEAGLRRIAISGELAGMLREVRERAERDRTLAPGWNPLGLVFPSEAGIYLNDSVVNKALCRACETAGVTRVSMHGLRHTSGTQQIEAGIPTKTVSERMGHANVSMTLQLYVHPDADAHRSAADLIAGRLRGRNAHDVTTNGHVHQETRTAKPEKG